MKFINILFKMPFSLVLVISGIVFIFKNKNIFKDPTQNLSSFISEFLIKFIDKYGYLEYHIIWATWILIAILFAI